MHRWKEINKRMKNKWKNKKSNKIVDMLSVTEIKNEPVNPKINNNKTIKKKKLIGKIIIRLKKYFFTYFKFTTIYENHK